MENIPFTETEKINKIPDNQVLTNAFYKSIP